MAEMTERAFSATRAAGQAGARYREVQSLWTKRVTYDATIAARNNPATAG
jgi:putative intracellular protease/amidase